MTGKQKTLALVEPLQGFLLANHFVGGGLLWYTWHWPLSLVIPQTVQYPLWQTTLNWVILALGSVCTFIYLAYIYVKTENILVASLAHIAINNASQSLSYFVVIQSQFLANLGQVLTMVIVVVILDYPKELDTFKHLTARV